MDKRYDGRSAAKDDSWADAFAGALTIATLKHTQPCDVVVFSDRGLTFDLSGWPKASPLEGMVSRRGTARQGMTTADLAGLCSP